MKIYSVRKSLTAGLSPHNDERIEVFFAGCWKAISGNPCKGCFNQDLWHQEYGETISPRELLQSVEEMSNGNKYVTIVGGEPTDQMLELYAFCVLLKEKGYHITLITHRTLAELQMMDSELLKKIDILIDGEYQEDKRIFDTDKRKGINHVVGSSNQKIWFLTSEGTFDITDSDEEKLRECYSKSA